MGNVEENLKLILQDIITAGYTLEIPKKYLIMLINKYSMNYWGYLNRLQIEGYIEPVNEHLFKIITLNYKEINSVTEQ